MAIPAPRGSAGSNDSALGRQLQSVGHVIQLHVICFYVYPLAAMKGSEVFVGRIFSDGPTGSAWFSPSLNSADCVSFKLESNCAFINNY